MTDLEHIRARLWALHLRGMAAAGEAAGVPREPSWRPPLEGEAAVRARARSESRLREVAREGAEAWLRGDLVICGAAVVPPRQ